MDAVLAAAQRQEHDGRQALALELARVIYGD